MIQFDNEIPKKFNVNEELFIPKETFHRVIKGTGDLKLEIIETEFEPNDYAIVEVIEEGNKKKKKTKKDACYYKVKSRYDVWPSAYSSGSLVRCRKVGAANWGNKSNESMDDSNNTVIKKIKSYRIPFKEFNQKMKTDWIPMWKEEYENDLIEINEMVARHLLSKIADDLVGGVEEINFKNKAKKSTNHFQMEMYLGEIILVTGPFIYVDDKHQVIAKRTKIEVLNSDYDDIAVLKESVSTQSLDNIDNNNRGISFEHEHLNTHHGQSDYELAIYEDGNIIGYIDYTLYDNEITVSYAFVRPDRRREGFGSMLIKKMKQLHPEAEYKPSLKTDLGSKFIHKDIQLPESKKTDFSKEKEQGLHGWFARQGGKGKSKGWVDCNTCKKDPETGRKKCKSCGRKEGESRAKYPACRPTPSACGTRGKGKKWGKKTKLDEKLVLSNYSDYAKIVAEAYDNATNFDESVVPSYISLIDSSKKLYKQLLSRVKVEFVDYDPYENKDEMIRDVKENGVLKISSLFNEHPLFSKEDNLKFRAVHDYYTHIIANQEFGLRGELKAYNTHAKLAPPSALPALFTEVVGQACYKIVYGDFPTQKICELHGFDYKNVGKIDDIDIINKQLDVDNNKSKGIYKNMENVKQKLDEMISNHSKESNNYMFWQNLKTMYHAVSEMKEMDFDSVDSMLSDGHGWALDHIATSKDDVEEVYHFLINKVNGGMIDKYHIQKQLNEAFMDDDEDDEDDKEQKPIKTKKTTKNNTDEKPLNIRRENKPFLPIIEK